MATFYQIHVRAATVRAQVMAFLKRGKPEHFHATDIFDALAKSTRGTASDITLAEVKAALKYLLHAKLIAARKNGNMNQYSGLAIPLLRQISNKLEINPNALPASVMRPVSFLQAAAPIAINVNFVNFTGNLHVELVDGQFVIGISK